VGRAKSFQENIMRLISVITLVAGLLMPSLAQANLITNGDFTSCPGCVNSNAFETLSGGSSAIASWTVTGASVDFIRTYWQAPPLGGNSVDLNGNGPGTISQQFSTGTGREYRVSFYLSGNPDPGSGAVKTANVSAGNFNQDFTFDTTNVSRQNMFWALQSFVFLAVADTTTLSFSGFVDDRSWSAAIGNVSVVEAPEPGTLMLIGGALFALFGYGAAMRRRHA